MSDRSWRQFISIGCAIPPFLSFSISESAGTLIFVSAYICQSINAPLAFDIYFRLSAALFFCSLFPVRHKSINNPLSPFELALVLLSSLVYLSHTQLWSTIMTSPLQAPHILFYYYNREPVNIYSTWASNFSTSPLLIF